MRPAILHPLFEVLETLPGLSAKKSRSLAERAGMRHIFDLLCHFPRALRQRPLCDSVARLEPGQWAGLTVHIMRHAPSYAGLPWRIFCKTSQHGEDLELIWFHVKGNWPLRRFPAGSERIVGGRIDFFRGKAQITHPDLVLPLSKRALYKDHESLYPQTGSIDSRQYGRLIEQALKKLPDLPEWLDRFALKAENWPRWKEALCQLHHPKTETELEASSPARSRLAYDELLAYQLVTAIMRTRMRHSVVSECRGHGRLCAKLRANLPFKPTRAQEQALTEILADLERPIQMHRLLQGDVGSGKTLVAFFALVSVIEAGRQAALMAPTEILARQHFLLAEKWLTPLGIRSVLLTGQMKARARKQALAELASGEASLAVGTHALLSVETEFSDLALAVIDEQHRFGVQQRLALAGKGSFINMLVMSATPIPRSLELAVYGDLDSSRLLEKPLYRKDTDTRLLSLERIDEVYDALERALNDDAERVFWICPAIEGSEDSSSTQARKESLAARFKADTIASIHGRLPPESKSQAIKTFSNGSTPILVATSVVEVGIDITEAGIIVIEGAEQFGLAQLHQLRGRVGRGKRQGYCLLLYRPPLSDIQRQRLVQLRKSNDGFEIAELDLQLRGAGDAFGTRQSGLPKYRFADIFAHRHLIKKAHSEARAILAKDPNLRTARGQNLRILMHLLDFDSTIAMLHAG